LLLAFTSLKKKIIFFSILEAHHASVKTHSTLPLPFSALLLFRRQQQQQQQQRYRHDMAARSGKDPSLPDEVQSRLDALTCQSWSPEAEDAVVRLAQLLVEWKAVGNACYSHGCFLAAIRCYTKLIALPGGDTAAIRSNRSAAYLQSSMHAGPSLALKDAERAVELEPTWFKAHVRVGDAQRLRGHVVEADEAYRKALALQADCEGAKAGLRALEEMVRMDEPPPPAPTTSTVLPGAFSCSSTTTPAARACSSDKSILRTTPHAEPAAPPITPQQQLDGWRREISVREDRTGMRPRSVSLGEADRLRGAAFKDSLLAKFRAKVETDTTLSNTLRERREGEVLRGDGVDYRDADKYRRVYAHATDGIGLAISADAYKEYIGKVDHRTW
jgi:tetratricopeptide (TPR) repeat protein